MSATTSRQYDVIVVGGGNAGICAALAAVESGARVLVVERAPYAWRGGNTAATGGSMRVVFNGLDDLLELMPDLSRGEIDKTDFGSYPEEDFFSDMGRVTEYRTDPDLAEVLIRQSHPTLKWMHSHGVRFVPQFGRYALQVDDQWVFSGGTVLESVGGGPGLVDQLMAACEALEGIEVLYDTRATRIVRGPDGISAVEVEQGGAASRIPARAVVLASGGFEANLEWRTRYLGSGWDLAKVRGTKYNTGDGIRMALDIGAAPAGQWSGCHAVGWDIHAPEGGQRPEYGDFQRHSYFLGLMINSAGRRFVDEGANLRPYTYAKYGAEILSQPGQRAWQVFDAKVKDYLRAEYGIGRVSKVTANSLEELADRLEGLDKAQFVKTVHEYNAAVDQQTPFQPNSRDGRAAHGLAIPKSNWANTIDTPPYEAYAVTCGITFTFGGVKIEHTGARVLDDAGDPISGLYAAGELVGGLFYFNYPGGTGLTSGSVFGSLAGRTAVSDLA